MNDITLNLKNENICPFIGLLSDAQTAMDNPSPQNYCHITKPISSPSLTHQRDYCLNAAYTRCKIFTENANKPISTGPDAPARKKVKWLPIIIVLILTISLIAGALLVASGKLTVWFLSSPAENPTNPSDDVANSIQMATEAPPRQITHEIQENSDQTGIAGSTPIVDSQIQPTIGLTPIPIDTEEPQPLLQTSPEKQQVFLLHQVTGGEDLLSIADKYQTSVEAIRAVNYNMAQELWVDTMIIIPLNQTDVTGVPPMIPIENTVSEKTIQDIAVEHGISPELLGSLNKLSPLYQLQIGDWLIMPHPIPSPT